MADVKFEKSVIEIEKSLRKVDNIIRQKGREILKDFNITAPQFIALQWLINEGDLTIGELSKKMSLACSTITDLIDRMEKNKLVVRTKDENDKRVVRIKVKEKGHTLVQEVLDKRRYFLTEKLKGFKEEDKEFLMKNLKSLHTAMKEVE
ncbi:MAG: MarR family transcriptional regulator [Firmicutes bacterium]|nr:MarR family transcriptional regulator [Bacillota bacterium]